MSVTVTELFDRPRARHHGLGRASIVGAIIGAIAAAPLVFASPEPVGAATCGDGVIEAEAGDLVGFVAGNDAAASGGGFIHQPEGAGSAWSPKAEYAATYCVSIPTSGLYRMEATTWSDSGTSDSFWLEIDGELVGDTGLWIVDPGAYVTSMVGAIGSNPVERYLAAGDHTVKVYLREDGTRLDSFRFVHQNDRCSSNGKAEAEQATLSGFIVGADKKASRKAYVWMPEGSGSHWAPDQGATAEFCLTIGQSGTYQLELTGLATDNSSDSFFVQVDDGAPVVYQMTTKGRWHDTLVHPQRDTTPFQYELSKGEHRVTIHAREDGAMLDRIELKRKPGFGGRCNAMSYEAEDGDIIGFQVIKDRQARGGAYVHVPEGNGSAWIPNQQHKVSFCFDVRTAGNYQLQTMVHSPDVNSDSFWLSLNGSSPGRARWDTAPGAFVPDVAAISGMGEPATVALAPGRHIIDVLLREDGTGLDSVSLVLVD
jgi:hypothetical protein